MRSVFEALAHNNPYPFEQFDENRWNHLVLKALFIGSKLHPMQGLGQRAVRGAASVLGPDLERLGHHERLEPAVLQPLHEAVADGPATEIVTVAAADHFFGGRYQPIEEAVRAALR